ncbi:traI domain protein [Escherichia coli]|nr:traI domain protein [Escherichia coli]
MDGVSGRVNLVDGDMDVQVVGVVMHGTDALMLGEAKPSADAVLNRALRSLPAFQSGNLSCQLH